MTIEEADRIDVIATMPDSDIVRLVIADHLDWDDLDLHMRLVQDKVNAYLAFVESGQLLRVASPPIPASPVVRIELFTLYTPPEEARALLREVAAFLAGVHIQLEVVVRDLS